MTYDGTYYSELIGIGRYCRLDGAVFPADSDWCQNAGRAFVQLKFMGKFSIIDMNIIKGTVLTQPRQWGTGVEFFLHSGEKVLRVIRLRREDQVRDILFLCIGQELVLCTYTGGSCIVAEKIRIVNYRERNYLLPGKEK